MDCKTCENYKPKDSEALKEFEEKLHDACCLISCSDCPLGNGTTDCKIADLWTNW